jgi:ferrous iron transport protein B
MLDHATPALRFRTIAIIGNPNAGKTTLFNALTGLRQKVGNYPGVTVEKKEGRILFPNGQEATLIDLPGTYSLTAASPDERVATEILLGQTDHTPPPDLVICVVDASNLERNLYLASQIIDQGLPLVIALNMTDVAHDQGIEINVAALEKRIGVRVIPTIGSKGKGMAELKNAILADTLAPGSARQWTLPPPVEEECTELIGMLQARHGLSDGAALHEAIALLSLPDASANRATHIAPEVLAHVKQDHQKLESLGFRRESVFIESRYEWIRQVCGDAVVRTRHQERTPSDKIDSIVTHRVWGFLIFLGLIALMFQSIFSWATVPMELIGGGFDWLGVTVTRLMPPGDLRNLIVHGGIAGVAAVVTFLPQILFLFLFIGLMEDTGYMARAAFIMDRLMSKVGLHGKSFIPMLSSFACAIPGIMSTRTIENPKDRLVTMLVAPLMSCSARLPVYTLLIAAFIPNTTLFGVLSLAGITLFSLYFLGLIAGLTMAWIFKRTLLKGAPPVFIMELPPYKLPSIKSILLHMWERSFLFLKKAGTIILGVSIILWFLASYPKVDNGTPAEQLQHSFAGQAGKLLEPAIKPLGFDWKIGIGLVTSLLQREVFVSTMGTIYNVKNTDATDGSVSLQQLMRDDRDPATGARTFTMLTAICIMVYYVLAMQCLSTVAVMRRETNGWKWPLVQIGYMTTLAYSVTFIVYHAGMWLGWGG